MPLVHNGSVPKIAAATVAENREMRREALLTAAATLMQRGHTFTVAEVAKEVGLSRSAVYEYYSSAAELIADVLVDEMVAWSDSLSDSIDPRDEPTARIHGWIREVLSYVADGRHALLRAAGTIELPPTRRSQVQTLHQDLIAPLYRALVDAGDADAPRTARYIWGVVDVAISRVETSDADVEAEIAAVIVFVDGAVAGTRK